MAYKKKFQTESRPSPGVQKRESGSSSPKPTTIVLGDELEYRIARLLIFMGYFVRRGRPVYTVGALDRATDLDVFGLRYTEPLHRESIVIECKSGDTGPLDRIFWLSGLKSSVGAQQAVLVRKGTKWNIKDFAKKSGVQVLDLFRVAELEKCYKVGAGDWPGLSERDYCARELDSWNKTLSSEHKLWELFLTLSGEIRYDEPFVGLNYLFQQLRLLTRSWDRHPSNSFHRLMLSECLSQVAVFLMQVAEQSFDLTARDREGFIRKGLTYGSLEPRYAERILNSAFNLTRQAVVHYTNRNVDIDRSLFEMPVPPGTDDIINTVEHLLTTYPISLNFPQVCDLLLSEVFLKENKSKGWLRRIFPQPDLALRVDTVMGFLKSLASIGACPRYIVDALAVPTIENGGSAQAAGTSTPTLFGPPSEPSQTTKLATQTEDQDPLRRGDDATNLQTPTTTEAAETEK